MTSKNAIRFYILTTILWMGCCAWLWYAMYHNHAASSLCLFKNISGLPCPACGSTRSLLSIFNGHWYTAWHTNPLGYLALIALILYPVWCLIDYKNRKASLLQSISLFDRTMKRHPILLVLLFMLLGSNWVWNIYKQL